MSSTVLGGTGRTLSVVEWVNLVLHVHARLAVDAVAIDGMKRKAMPGGNAAANAAAASAATATAATAPRRASLAPPTTALDPIERANTSQFFTMHEARAILLTRLVSLLEGRTRISAAVAQFLIHLLNHHITPVLPVPNTGASATGASASTDGDLSVMHSLAHFLTTDASQLAQLHAYDANGEQVPYVQALSRVTLNEEDWECVDPTVAKAAALAASAPASAAAPATPATMPVHLRTPGLSPAELTSFVHSRAPSTSLTALSVYGASLLLDEADAVAALSLEAIRAYAEPFDAIHSDVYRPHKGQMQVAGNLRLLLDGSKLVDSGARTHHDHTVFRCIPQFHGPARDAYQLAARGIKVELAAAEANSSGTQPKDVGLHHAQPVLQIIALLQSSLSAIASGSVLRAKDIVLDASLDGETRTKATFGVRLDYPVFTSSDAAATSTSTASPLAPTALNDLFVQKIAAVEHLVSAATTHALPTLTSDPLASARFLQHTVHVLHQAVSTECVVALQCIGAQEAVVLEQNRVAMAAKEEAARKREEEMKAQGKKFKDAKKTDKGGRELKGLPLGNGTAAFRTQLVSHTTPVRDASTLQHALTRVQAYLDPLGAHSLTLRDSLTTLLTATNQTSKPKIAKGTRDSTPEQITIREKAFALIKGVFLRHGAVGIDTPVFELKETLTNKYGEDSKLIYDLADQGGELLALRYDLTVPFARYLACYSIENMKRYHVARVYRRDNPAMTRGRFREFYQCDFDIAGVYPAMVPDAECLKVLTEILDALPIGGYKVKLNHRKLLDSIMAISGVPPEKYRTICSAIDKLDKEEWKDVREEMVVKKGLPEDVADRIGTYVNMTVKPVAGNAQALLRQLEADAAFASSEMAKQAFTELGLLFAYLDAFGCLHRFSFDLSLARGLDYYTGVIYEAVLTDTDRVGSIAAGGRYDELVGMFSGKQVPAVGVSIGIERIFAILEEAEQAKGKIRKNQTAVLVASIGNGFLVRRMQVCQSLWAANVNTEFLYDANPKPKKQLDYAMENAIPIIVWLGEEEEKAGKAKIKNMQTREEVEVAQADLVSTVQQIVRSLPGDAY